MNKAKRKDGLTFIIFIVSLYIFIFQNILQNYISIIKYFDEIFALFVIPAIVIYIKKNNNKIYIRSTTKKMVLILGIIAIVGLISNIRYSYQPYKIVLADMLIFYKFFMVYILSSIVWNSEFFNHYDNKILKHIKIIIVIFTLLTFGNYIFDLFVGDIRFGLKANRLFYDHPTYLAAICVFLLALLIKCSKKLDFKYMVIIIIILFTTLRFKAIGSALAILAIIWMINRTNKRISVSKIGIIGLVCLIFAYDQISYYFFENDGFARKELLTASLQIGQDYFPFGTGFATFGSHYSTVNYSKIYYLYSLNNVYGLQINNSSYASDTFWPMIIGQFGYAGLVLYCICLYYIYKEIQRLDLKNNKYDYIAKIVCLIYLIISSTSETAFTSPTAIPLAIILGFNITNDSKKMEVKNEKICDF